jgi:D-beta-D-heptose 7-phosphate kinase/D-beta-D-heptose 1-phosphate adenosyltransferase
LRVLSHRQQVLRLDFEDDFASEDPTRLAGEFEHLLNDHVLVIASDYAKGVLSGIEGLIALARRRGVPILVDPKGTDFARYSGATVITPNAAEFLAVAGQSKDEDDFVRAGDAMRHALRVDNLLVTRGEKGMTLFSFGGLRLHVPAHALDVYDVTGAGDTAIATLAAGMAAGLEIQDAVRLANRAAGIVVGRKGTATVTAHELLVAEGLSPAFTTVDEVIDRIGVARRRGERIVMTNGCFDILHAGHVEYLTRARALGDRLVVAVNSDDSVARLKGEGRPVNRVEYRMAMLSALRVVDFVVPFDGSIDAEGTPLDSPLEIILRVAPDVLVKGSDYSIDEIVGAQEVAAAGGEVRTLPLVSGLSTSSILERLSGQRG